MRTAFLGAALALLLAAPAAAAEAPRVVASVKPLHALAATVMRGVATPRLLVAGGASPHAYSLAPSDAAALARAQLVLWVGPELEGFLEKPLASLAGGAEVLTLARSGRLRLLAPREAGAWRPGEEHGTAHGGEVDPHLWLDPANAIAVGELLAERLGRVDPARAGTYADNASALAERLGQLDAELAGMLAPVRGIPYLVFHDAYQYLERRYGLAAVGAVAVSAERPPGARRLLEIRRRIERLQARCVFREPQFAPALVRTVVEGTGAEVAVLDPLGADLAPGPESYFALMRTLARSLRDCLLGRG